jgi:hypothetical protein
MLDATREEEELNEAPPCGTELGRPTRMASHQSWRFILTRGQKFWAILVEDSAHVLRAS